MHLGLLSCGPLYGAPQAAALLQGITQESLLCLLAALCEIRAVGSQWVKSNSNSGDAICQEAYLKRDTLEYCINPTHCDDPNLYPGFTFPTEKT